MFLASENGVWYGGKPANNVKIMRLESNSKSASK
jgi:hypothetical protein